MTRFRWECRLAHHKPEVVTLLAEFPHWVFIFSLANMDDYISTIRILRSFSGSLQYLTKHLLHCGTDTFWVSRTGPTRVVLAHPD